MEEVKNQHARIQGVVSHSKGGGHQVPDGGQYQNAKRAPPQKRRGRRNRPRNRGPGANRMGSVENIRYAEHQQANNGAAHAHQHINQEGGDYRRPLYKVDRDGRGGYPVTGPHASHGRGRGSVAYNAERGHQGDHFATIPHSPYSGGYSCVADCRDFHCCGAYGPVPNNGRQQKLDYVGNGDPRRNPFSGHHT